MWYCAQCGEEIEDTFEACWNCGTGEDGIVDPDFKPAEPPGEDVGNVIDVAPHNAQLVQALEFSQYNLGLGIIAGSLLPLLLFGGLTVAIGFSWLDTESESDWKTILLLLAGADLVFGWWFISAVRGTPLHIRIADKVTVRYLLHTCEWESYQLRTIRFFHFVKVMWLITVPVPTSRYQLANLTLGERDEVEFFVSPEQELELYRAFAPDEFD